jgi:hypothetical protein
VCVCVCVCVCIQEAKRAKLTVSEMVALRLFTGPMYEKYNKVLRSVLDTDSGVSLEANSYSTTIGLIIFESTRMCSLTRLGVFSYQNLFSY